MEVSSFELEHVRSSYLEYSYSNSISDYRRKAKGRREISRDGGTLSWIPVKNNSIPRGSGRRRAKVSRRV